VYTSCIEQYFFRVWRPSFYVRIYAANISFNVCHIYMNTYFFAYIHIHAICIVPTIPPFIIQHTNICVYPLTQKYILSVVLSLILRSCLLNIFWRICASCHSPLIRFLTCKNMRHVVENFILFYFFHSFWFLNGFLLLFLFCFFTHNICGNMQHFFPLSVSHSEK
jgi:hypothetical protein